MSIEALYAGQASVWLDPILATLNSFPFIEASA